MAAAAYLPQFASSTSAGEYAQLHVKGHPMLAYFMGNAPLAAHVRRFAALSMRNILYLQADIQFLEKKLLLAENRDSRSGRGKESSYSLNWQDLKDSANSENKEQYELIRDLRVLMEQYGKLITPPLPVHPRIEVLMTSSTRASTPSASRISQNRGEFVAA